MTFHFYPSQAGKQILIHSGRIMMLKAAAAAAAGCSAPHSYLLFQWSAQVNQVTMETLHLSMLPSPDDKIVPFKPTSPSLPPPPLPCLPEFCHYVSRRLKIEMSSRSIKEETLESL